VRPADTCRRPELPNPTNRQFFNAITEGKALASPNNI
jgi:hypothetical protein